MLGLVLIPMVDEQGELQYLTFFQAFYWVSYTATTIGYGEIPYAFSEWQRIWVTFSIYYTVPSWFYAIGKIIALLQDSTFQYALSVSRFQRSTAKINRKFCIICGCGEAGLRLTLQFLKNGYQCVIIEQDAERLNKLSLDPRLEHVLSVVGNADNVDILEMAGIRSPYCRAVLAITDSEAVNLKVALAARLLSSEHRYFKIVCRTYTRHGSNQAKALTTDIIINTHKIFTAHLLTALRRPSIAQLQDLFLGVSGTPYEALPQPPSGGRWLICGHDALGKTLKRFLDYEGIDCIMIDPNLPNSADSVTGLGNEAITLREAQIERAQAVVAARTSDAENLSIAMTAKSMQPSAFVIGKQNKSVHQKLFAVAGFDRVMGEAELIFNKVFPQIALPLLSRFLFLISRQDELWGQQLLKRLQKLCPDLHPWQTMIRIDNQHAPAVTHELASGRLLRLQTLWTNPQDADSVHEVIPLLLLRQGQEMLLPAPATPLQQGDRVLLAYAQPRTERRIRLNLLDENHLYYAVHGKEKNRSALLRYWQQRGR